MQTLINDLLQFSRQTIDSADFVNTDLNELVRESMIELEIEIERTRTQINIDSLPILNAVPGLMRQLFYNLINNGIKFRKPDTAPVINIYSEKVNAFRDNTNFYKITISDNGIGFDTKYAEDIFVVFKRLHSFHEFEGTGVGLSICKKIVEKHNGYITAHSKLGEGSNFVIMIPEQQPRISSSKI